MRRLALLLLLLSSAAFAQAEQVSPSSTVDDHFKAWSFTAAGVECGLTLMPDSNICMAGTGGTSRFRWESTAGRFVLEGSLTLAGTGGGLRLLLGPLPACLAGLEGELHRGPEGGLYECREGQWLRVWSEADGILPGPDRLITVHSVVAQALPGQYAYRSNNNAWWDVGDGPGDYFYSDGGVIRFNSMSAGDMTLDILGNRTPSSPINLLANTGVRLWPFASLPVCAAGSQGLVATLTGDGKLYQCNGVDMHPLTRGVENGTSLDFPELAAGTESTLTLTVTGASPGNGVECTATAALPEGVGILQEWVSSANEVSIRLRNWGAISQNPAPTAFACVVRK